MENITLGQVLAALTFIIAIVVAVVKIRDGFKKIIKDIMKESFDEIKKDISEVKSSVEEVSQRQRKADLENCKNYLITYIAEIKRGEQKDEIERQRFYEEYSYYTANGGNSYVRSDFEELKKKGRI